MATVNAQPHTTLLALMWSARGRVFHTPRCRWAWRIKATNLQGGTRDEATKSGRRPCKACGKDGCK